jgi:hypothetical protein
VGAEGRRRPHHSTQVAGVGDGVEYDDQRCLTGLLGTPQQVVDLAVPVRGHGQHQALVNGPTGQPVEVDA